MYFAFVKTIIRLILLTIILDLLIVIGAGHGFSFLGLSEILSVRDFIQGKVQFSVTGSYSDSVFTAAILSAIGQILCIIAYTTKIETRKIRSIYLGLLFLFFGYILLCIDFKNMAISTFAIGAGSPFLVAGILLFVFTVKSVRTVVHPGGY